MNTAGKALARLVNDEESILFDALTRCGSEATLLAHRIRSLVNATTFDDDDPETVEVEIEIVQALLDGRAKPFCQALAQGSHSSDLVKVHAGHESGPVWLCGKHAQAPIDFTRVTRF